MPQHPYIFRAVDPDSDVRRAVLHVGVEVPWDLDLRATSTVLLTTVTAPHVDPALAAWLGAALRPMLRPQDERAVVFMLLVTEAFTDYFARGATAPSLQRCHQHHDDACTALLQSLPPGTLPRPLSQAAGILLVREALRAGGRDAYRRLVARPRM